MGFSRGLMSVAITALLAGCFNGGSNDLGQVELNKVKSDRQLKDSLFQSYLHIYEYDDCYECTIDRQEADASTNESSASESFSGTNLQEAGVDEGDVWKYDGEHFYVLNPGHAEYMQDPSCTGQANCEYGYFNTPSSIRIVANTQQTLSIIDLGDQLGSELYLNSDQLILINRGYSRKFSLVNGGSSSGFVADDSIEPMRFHDNRSLIATWNISNKQSPESLHRIEFETGIRQSRRMGDDIYVVSDFHPNIDGLIYNPQTQGDISHNQTLIDAAQPGDFLPKVRIDGVVMNLVNASDCYAAIIPSQQNDASQLSVLTRYNTQTNTLASTCIAAPIGGMYMSQNNLYLFNDAYYEFEEDQDDSSTRNHGEGRTHLHQFSLNENFQYKGSAIARGTTWGARASFRLGELHDGSIALVTSTSNWSDLEHFLTVFKSNGTQLNTISQLPNEARPEAIGKPGERIYSVRFMQNRAYIVTFQNFDPLYAIDLSNTLDPKIAGELEIPGFSEYLHPVGDDLLIGIGKSAITGDSGRTWVQGIKVSLFDVSDMNNPLEVDTLDIGKRGSYTALQYDHHAFTGLNVGDDYRFAFPISLNDGEPQGDYYTDPESEYFPWIYSGLHLFEVTNNQLSFQGAMITHRNEGNQNWDSWNTRRSLIQGDEVYHLSGQGIYQANWYSPQEISDEF